MTRISIAIAGFFFGIATTLYVAALLPFSVLPIGRFEGAGE